MLAAVIITGIAFPWFLLFYLIVAPAGLILFSILKKPLQRHNTSFRKEVEAVSARMSEMLHLIPLIRAHRTEEDEIERIDKNLSQVQAAPRFSQESCLLLRAIMQARKKCLDLESELRSLANAMLRGFQERDKPESKIVQSCVRCGLCLPHCPTYLETLHETSSPRGRIHLIEAVERGQLGLTDPGFVRQMYQCLDCRACEAVCPSGVEYGKLVESARTQIERAQPGSLLKRGLRWFVFTQLFGDLRVFRLLCRLLILYQRSGLQWLARHLGVLRLLRLSEMERLLPPLPTTFLLPANQHYLPDQSSASPEQPDCNVAMFAGCIMSTVFAETDRATLRVLLAHGCAVSLPAGQGCCGALTVHAGDLDAARVLARRNIQAFEQSEAKYIVVNAAGCGAALKEYAHLLHDDPLYARRAEAFSARVRDISEILLERPVRSRPGTLNLRVTYQEPCHLAHAQRITQAPRQLLKGIPGLELVEMTESALCCGSAGIYNLTQPAMSRRLRKRKIQHTTATGVDVVITANPGCQLQLKCGLSEAHSAMRVVHLVDVLDLAYRQDSAQE